MRLSTGFRSSTGIALLTMSVFSAPALAATELPPVKVSDDNTVATCATPGRLMGFVKARNAKLDPKFEKLAVEYMRHGEQLGLRWDYGFFQMLVETGFLTFTGDVKPEQNNFAGLGTTGGGVKGEKFKDVSSGARAHLEHLAMYAGEKIENPVAERTKNIQDWEVLTKWQKTIKGPMTFTHLAKQWAPKTRSYPSDIKAVADRFMTGLCKDADPNPELLAELKGTGAATVTDEKPISATGETSAQTAGLTKGDELAKRANEEARVEGAAKTSLGATSLLAAASAALAPSPDVKILNATPAPETVLTPDATLDVTADVAVASPATAGSKVEMASLTGAGKADLTPEVTAEPDTKAGKIDKSAAAVAGGKCKVFTASYGGESAVIVKAMIDKVVNYTVLHVNEGAEKREAEAYISAYAKGGETVGSEFKNPDQALDKAFELCPEG